MARRRDTTPASRGGATPTEFIEPGRDSPLWKSLDASNDWLEANGLEVSAVSLWRWRAGPESRRALALKLWGAAHGVDSAGDASIDRRAVFLELLRAAAVR